MAKKATKRTTSAGTKLTHEDAPTPLQNAQLAIMQHGGVLVSSNNGVVAAFSTRAEAMQWIERNMPSSPQ